MIIKLNKKELSKFLLIFFSILFKYIEMWSYSLSETFQKSSLILIIMFSILIIILSEMKIIKKYIKKLMVLGIICIIITLITKSTNFLISYLFALVFSTSKDGDEKFLKYFMISSLLLFCFTLILNISGILPSTVIVRINNGVYTYRNNLGFYGANSLFLCMYPIIVSYLALYNINQKRKLIRVIQILILFIISYIFYKITDCRAGMLSVIFVLFLCNFKKLYTLKITKFLVRYYFLIFLVISIIFAHSFGNDTTNAINRLSSGRMYFWSYYIKYIGINLFGSSPIKGLPLDNIYLNSLYVYGLIYYIIYFVITLIATKKMVNNKTTIFMIISFAVYSFFENNVSFSYNFILPLLLFYVINSDLKLVDNNTDGGKCNE